MNIQAGIDRLDELKRVYGNDYVDYSELREILVAMQDDNLASKTVNGSSLGWMLDQIRKQEKMIEELEKGCVKKVALSSVGSFVKSYEPSVPEKPVTDEKPEQTHDDKMYKALVAYRDLHCPTLGNFFLGQIVEIVQSHKDTSKVSIPRDVLVYWKNEMDKRMCKYDMDRHDQELYDAIKQALKGQ